MIRLFSKMLDPSYLTFAEALAGGMKVDSNLTDIDVDTTGISEQSSVSISVGYTFSDRKRINTLASGKKYGGKEPFSSLYEYLVELNNGFPFIDSYFETLFKPRFESVIRRQTRLLLMARSSGKISDEDLFSGFEAISADIKKHIQQCLATGRIPLYFSMKPSTAARRKKLGLTPIRAFFATGQLIDNLVISYSADWR